MSNENQNSDSRKLLMIIAGIVGFAIMIFMLVRIFSGKQNKPTYDDSESKHDTPPKTVENESTDYSLVLNQAASEVNKSCPMMIDQETRLDNAVALPTNIFQYNYTLINYSIQDIPDLNALKNNMSPSIINTVKSNPDLKIYRDMKVTMTYNYNDRDGIFLFKIPVTPEMYGSY
ncbi:MAG: hypothetical protein IPI46_01805 [Bacteroidetes bacterium]|nr:hypothetical protein [Bacteroidota bacterium]